MDTEVKIKKSELDRLQDRDIKLQYLELGGVANWTWYDIALKEYNANNKREEIINRFIEELHQVMAEGHLTYPAGFGCGHQLDIDEEFVVKLLNDVVKDIKDLENE